MAQPTIRTRLCPHCANSIAADALRCLYCKADLSPMPQWPERDEPVPKKASRPEKAHLSVKSKAILSFGLLLFAFGVFLVGGQQERSDFEPLLAKTQQESLEKDKKIKDLETQVARINQRVEGYGGEIEQLKAQLAASQKELAARQKEFAASQKELAANQKDLTAARKRLTEATRELDRLAASRAQPAPRAGSRTAEASPPPAPPRRAPETGLYETVRPTTVFEEPALSSRILSRIGKGTQVTAVRSVGDWLEIRSQHGNPPGFIRADDAALISRSN
jgi:hypothetical protein